MHRPYHSAPTLLLLAAASLAGCGESSLPPAAGTGPNPTLPPPNQTMLPTVQVAAVQRWTSDSVPAAASGLRAVSFADGLEHPRWLYVLPNGDVLVAESNAPPKGEEVKGEGVKGFFKKMMMKKAGAGTPSANRITLLRDADGDGKAELRRVFIEGVQSPFGMALVGDDLYVAEADAVRRFPYRSGETRIASTGEKLVDLPGGPRNHHWTKSLVASPDGRFLYVGVGSNSDHGENGMAEEKDRAAIWEIERATGRHRIYADGLRNPVGLAFEPGSKQLWAVVNERDELGNDLVPDYLTSVREGGFYGWPYSYYGQHLDPRVKDAAAATRVAQAIVPDYALGSHVAPLGLAFSRPGVLPNEFGNGAFVGEHGSWNRKPPSGYKVVFVPFRDGRPAGEPIDVLTGFLDAEGKAQGRPVGVALDRRGALLVADDVGNRIWWVGPDQRSAGAQ